MAECFVDPSEQMSTDPWFGLLDARSRHLLLKAARPMQLAAGSYLFRQGDAADGMYGLCTGTLKVSTLRVDGKESILAVLEAGNWFAESACVDVGPRQHDVMAMSACSLLHVNQHALEGLLHHKETALALLRLQAMHTRTLFNLLEDTNLRSTRARVARRLGRLASGDASPGPQVRQAIAVTQEHLAMMLGITRQTLSIELKAMAAAGAISMGYGRIEIVSTERLRAFEAE